MNNFWCFCVYRWWLCHFVEEHRSSACRAGKDVLCWDCFSPGVPAQLWHCSQRPQTWQVRLISCTCQYFYTYQQIKWMCAMTQQSFIWWLKLLLLENDHSTAVALSSVSCEFIQLLVLVLLPTTLLFLFEFYHEISFSEKVVMNTLFITCPAPKPNKEIWQLVKIVKHSSDKEPLGLLHLGVVRN